MLARALHRCTKSHVLSKRSRELAVNTKEWVSLVGWVVTVAWYLTVLMARLYLPAAPGFPNPPALNLRSLPSVARTFVQYCPFERYERLVVAPPGRAQPSVAPTA